MLVLALDDTGRVGRCHVFGPADDSAAIAMMNDLHALLGGPRRRVRSNLATMGVARWAAAMRVGDSSAILAAHAPGYVNVHHKIQDTLSYEEQRGEELEIAGRARVESQALASLGERHALHRVRMSWVDDALDPGLEPGRGLAGDVSYDLLLVSRTSRTGADIHDDMFEAEQLGLAVGCLIQRWAQDELEGAARERALGCAAGWQFGEAINSRDWARYQSQNSDDVLLLDHRSATMGELRGSDAIINWARAAVDASEGMYVRLTDILALSQDAALVKVVSSGTLHGGAFEITSLVAARYGLDGRFDRLEYFAEEQPGAAWTAFEWMEGSTSSKAAEETGACQWMRRWADALLNRDLDALGAMYGAEAVVEDRRQMMQETLRGPAQNLRNVAAVLELGGAELGLEIEVLATRLDRLALFHNRFLLEAGHVEILFVVQLEETTGLLETGTVYGGEEIDAAYAQLDECTAELADRAGTGIRLLSGMMAAPSWRRQTRPAL
ncbi:MAG TPA: hypothetical protein VMU63_00790 [Acidimicrobiales bacterium]|nr:hypothetical protein [Acidimicrobiales bacterium]